MITREDLDRAEHWGKNADELVGIDVMTELREWVDVAEALERAMSDAWDADSTLGEIAGRWIKHMATTHGAHCAGPHCTATADTPAYVAVLRRMWRNTAGSISDRMTGYRWAISDLAHELGVDLNG